MVRKKGVRLIAGGKDDRHAIHDVFCEGNYFLCLCMTMPASRWVLHSSILKVKVLRVCDKVSDVLYG